MHEIFGTWSEVLTPSTCSRSANESKRFHFWFYSTRNTAYKQAFCSCVAGATPYCSAWCPHFIGKGCQERNNRYFEIPDGRRILVPPWGIWRKSGRALQNTRRQISLNVEDWDKKTRTEYDFSHSQSKFFTDTIAQIVFKFSSFRIRWPIFVRGSPSVRLVMI